MATILFRAAAITLSLGIAIGVGSLAGARDRTPESMPPALKGIADCRAIAAPTERLACYDKQAATLVAAAEQGNVRVMDRESVQKARRSLFGFTVPSLKIFGGSGDDDDADAIRSVTGKARSARILPGGQAQFTLEDGAVWLTNDAVTNMRTPRVGDSVEIKHGALSAYWVSFNGGPKVKCHRVS